jgi:hypothetical protein
VATRAQYYQLAERLRQHGFSEDTSEGAPVCRWVGNGITLDVMPVDDAELKAELIQRFAQLSQDQNFLDAISGHMRPDETSQARVPAIIATSKKISELPGKHA